MDRGTQNIIGNKEGEFCEWIVVHKTLLVIRRVSFVSGSWYVKHYSQSISCAIKMHICACETQN